MLVYPAGAGEHDLKGAGLRLRRFISLAGEHIPTAAQPGVQMVYSLARGTRGNKDFTAGIQRFIKRAVRTVLTK